MNIVKRQNLQVSDSQPYTVHVEKSWGLLYLGLSMFYSIAPLQYSPRRAIPLDRYCSTLEVGWCSSYRGSAV